MSPHSTGNIFHLSKGDHTPTAELCPLIIALLPGEEGIKGWTQKRGGWLLRIPINEEGKKRSKGSLKGTKGMSIGMRWGLIIGARGQGKGNFSFSNTLL